jgi:hypothetical protein
MSSARSTATSIHLGSCAASETIVAKTASSRYELIIRRGDCGDVLVRGGNYFADFCPVLFLGSINNDLGVERHTIRVGLRMTFLCDDQIIVTSEVQSLSGHPASDAKAACAATQ